MFRRLCLIISLVFSILMLFSCSNASKKDIVIDAPSTLICEIIEEDSSIIGEPMSFAVADDGRFVVTDLRNLYLYSSEGVQIKQIGNSGRAAFEYIMPWNVKILGDTIYLWSAGSLKFITYTLDGEAIAEYPYNSALNDFIPFKDYICIYPAGLREENIIDIYDTKEGRIVKSFGESSPEHKILLSSAMGSALHIKDEKLYYAAKDNPTVYCYDLQTEENSVYVATSAKDFVVENNPSSDDEDEYLFTNSQTISIFEDNDRLYLITVNGKAKWDDDGSDFSDRIYMLYDLKSNKKVASYTNASIGADPLFNSTSAGLYFLKISDNESEGHTLHKLMLK